MFEPPLDLKGARILFVNDDGIRATGLKALEQIAKSFSKDVWVFAPEEEQSGAGHSLSLNKPVWVSRISAHRFSVGGSPTDCVMMEITEYMSDKRPYLVLSGVNRGQNLGGDVTYSGTVAGAMEAMLLGIPVIAMSQQVSEKKVQFKTAETLAPSTIKKLLREKWLADVFMNVNFPPMSRRKRSPAYPSSPKGGGNPDITCTRCQTRADKINSISSATRSKVNMSDERIRIIKRSKGARFRLRRSIAT